MDTQSLWLIIPSLVTAVTAVVALVKARLEIDKLKDDAAKRERRVVLPTNEEVKTFSRPRFSMRRRVSSPQRLQRACQNFCQSITTLLDAMGDGERYTSLLHAAHDQGGKVIQMAPTNVAGAATDLLDILQPMIDCGPPDELLGRIARALHDFENACRKDGRLEPTPVTEFRT